MRNQSIQEVKAVYKQLLDAWNNQDARGMVELFTEDGESIGFDGSISKSKEEIFAHFHPIFEHHQTARYISKVK